MPDKVCRICGGNEEPPVHNAKCAYLGFHSYEYDDEAEEEAEEVG